MEAAGDPYLATVQARLSAEGFGWEENVPWKEGSSFRAVAKRSRFAASRFGMEERWFLFGEFPAFDQGALAGFPAASFEYIVANKLNPLPRGLFKAVTCFAVALAGTTDEATAQAVRAQQPVKHWSAIVFPVVLDRTTGVLHMYQDTPVWGAAYFKGLRRTAQEKLAPA